MNDYFLVEISHYADDGTILSARRRVNRADLKCMIRSPDEVIELTAQRLYVQVEAGRAKVSPNG